MSPMRILSCAYQETVRNPFARLNLYCDKRRDILGNIASARLKFRGQSPRDFPRAQAIFPSISRLESQYRHSHLPNNGSTAAVAYAAVTAVAANVVTTVP